MPYLKYAYKDVWTNMKNSLNLPPHNSFQELRYQSSWVIITPSSILFINFTSWIYKYLCIYKINTSFLRSTESVHILNIGPGNIIYPFRSHNSFIRGTKDTQFINKGRRLDLAIEMYK